MQMFRWKCWLERLIVIEMDPRCPLIMDQRCCFSPITIFQIQLPMAVEEEKVYEEVHDDVEGEGEGKKVVIDLDDDDEEDEVEEEDEDDEGDDDDDDDDEDEATEESEEEDDLGTEYLVRPVAPPEEEEDASDFEPLENGEEEGFEENDESAKKTEAPAKRKRAGERHCLFFEKIIEKRTRHCLFFEKIIEKLMSGVNIPELDLKM